MAGSTAAPESIPFVTGQDSPVPSTFTPIMAKRIGDRLNLRQRFNFVWANSVERNAQTGQVQGSLGYQLDTKTDYIFDDGKWELVTPHSEWNATASFGDGAGDPVGTMTASPGYTSSTSFVVPTGASGELKIIDRGIYAISFSVRLQPGLTSVGTSELNIQRVSSGGIITTGYIMPGRQIGAANVPNLYNITDNNVLRFNLSKRTGGTHSLTSTVRITRIG